MAEIRFGAAKSLVSPMRSMSGRPVGDHVREEHDAKVLINAFG